MRWGIVVAVAAALACGGTDPGDVAAGATDPQALAACEVACGPPHHGEPEPFGFVWWPQDPVVCARGCSCDGICPPPAYR